ncbi:DeoR family transcriptional regulator [Streptomyces mexicanus]|uniref:DeoR family transcriptional regulator n=1 Tax=Streptomyces mexicanus TaxID=178566 RepID=UPI0036BDF7E7
MRRGRAGPPQTSARDGPTYGFVDVIGVAADFGVSEETVRRDVNVLEGRGLLRRTHGGGYTAASVTAAR